MNRQEDKQTKDFNRASGFRPNDDFCENGAKFRAISVTPSRLPKLEKEIRIYTRITIIAKKICG